MHPVNNSKGVASCELYTFIRPQITEAGALGAAIIAGIGSGALSSFRDGVQAMVKLERNFEPNPQRQKRYAEQFEKYESMNSE